MPFLAKEHHPVPTKDLLSWVSMIGVERFGLILMLTSIF